MVEYKDRCYNTEFCSCPNFNWSYNFASKLKNKLNRKEEMEKIAIDISWRPFTHWSIDVLDAFEEFWDYGLFHHLKKNNDYLVLSLKKNNLLDCLLIEL